MAALENPQQQIMVADHMCHAVSTAKQVYLLDHQIKNSIKACDIISDAIEKTEGNTFYVPFFEYVWPK